MASVHLPLIDSLREVFNRKPVPRVEERPPIEYSGRKFFPYARVQDALAGLHDAQVGFEQMFTVRVIANGGYLLTSQEMIYDARGNAGNITAPLQGVREAHAEISKRPIYLSR